MRPGGQRDPVGLRGVGVLTAVSNEAYRVLNDAQKLAADRGDEYISTEHILIALAQSPACGPLLDERGATPAALMDALANVRARAGSPTPTPRRLSRRWRSTART